MNTACITWMERRISPMELGVRGEEKAVKDAVAFFEKLYPKGDSQFAYDVISIEEGRARKVEAALVPYGFERTDP